MDNLENLSNPPKNKQLSPKLNLLLTKPLQFNPLEKGLGLQSNSGGGAGVLEKVGVARSMTLRLIEGAREDGLNRRPEGEMLTEKTS